MGKTRTKKILVEVKIVQDTIKENLLRIQEEIAPYRPNIIAVTKYFDENAIISAYNAGLRDFAESRVIEASQKIDNVTKHKTNYKNKQNSPNKEKT